MIHWTFTPYAVPLFVGTAVMLLVLLIAWQRRSTRGAVTMGLLTAAAMLYSLGYAFELGSSRLSDARLWIAVEYMGTTTIPGLMFLLVLAYTGHQRWQTPLNTLVLFLIPAITLLFAWTNSQHELIWRHLVLKPVGDQWRVDFTPGGWYWVHTGYSWLMMGSSIFLLAKTYRENSGLYRQQLGVMLVGFLIPIAANAIYLSGVIQHHLDLNAYAMVPTSLIIAWGLFNYHLFDIVPVAREAALDGMTDAVIIIDNQDRVVDLNAAAQDFSSRKIANCIGQPIVEIFPELLDVLIAYRDTPTTHAEIAIEMGHQEHFFDVSMSHLQDQPGKQAGYLVVLRDISARVKAETALTETNLRLMTLRQVDAELNRKLDVHYVADIAIDAALRVTLGDAAVLSLAEEDGMRAIRVLGPYPNTLLNSLMDTNQGVTARVIRTRSAMLIPDVTQDPDYIASAPNMRSQITIPLLSGRKLMGIITVETAEPDRFTTEVFETFKLLSAHIATAIDNAYSYEEREKLVKELEAFSRTVAHDLKNPLASVTGYAELALDNYDRLADDQKKMFLETILRNGQKAVDIINALLLLARVRRDQEVQFSDLNTERILEEVKVRLQPLIEECSAEIILPSSWPVAFGYAPWVEEIWANYLSNAIKYGGTPPRAELGADELPGGKIRFWVRDNGEGLNKEDQAKLFRPFTRLGQSDAPGHGLGLSIVQSIAERLKGEVGVESTPGQGSLFYFTLPAAHR